MRAGGPFEGCDVAVFGAGAAGLSAAIAAAGRGGLRVALFCREGLGAGGSTEQTHAVSACLRAGDSPQRHYNDTMAAGAGVNDPALARALVEGAPARVRELEAWGLILERAAGGGYDVNGYGGHSARRGLRAPALGPALLKTLIARLRGLGVEIHEGVRLTGLHTRAGRATAAEIFLRRERRFARVPFSSAVLATGGGTAMYGRSSASRAKTCSGVAAAARAGARLVDLEMIQFHPTGLVLPGDPRDGGLVPEWLRGEGAVLRDARGKRFLNEADARDVAARAIAAELARGPVRLDCSGVPRARVAQALDRLERGLAARLPGRGRSIPVAPTAHSLMGGVAITPRAETSLAGLYACGEDAGGVHGANRLGGNGLAEALVFGEIAGREAARHAAARGRASRTQGRWTPSVAAGRETRLFARALSRLRASMDERAGVVKSQAGLRKLEAELVALREEAARARPAPAALDACLDLRELLEVSLLSCRAGLERGDNAGAFFKTDDAGRPARAAYSVSWIEAGGFRRLPRAKATSR